VRVAFEFIEKLGAPFYAFHDRDVAPEGRTLKESNKSLEQVTKVLKEEQKRTGVRLLWGTACLFVHTRYLHGASTSCNADVFAYAAAQVKKALESFGAHPGHVFNLGHGITPDVNPEHLGVLVDAVHELSANQTSS